MSTITRRTTRRRDPGRVLWLVTSTAWLVIVVVMIVPSGMWGMPAMAAEDLARNATDGPLAAIITVFLCGWVVMVAAMMLPTTIPMARLFTVVTSDAPSRRAVRMAFYGAYLGVWLATGVLGLVGATVIRSLAVDVPDGYILAVALALAGAFQFSPLKSRCLQQCRDPRSFILTRYRRGVEAAWQLGLRYAAYCLGCCWALMAVMFAVGSGGLFWMLCLTAVMVAEKTARWGDRLVVPIGVWLLAAAVVAALLALHGSSVTLPAPSSPPTQHHH